MKKLLTIFSLVLLSSCSNEVNEVPSHRLIENGGLTYEIGSNNPFTGVSVNYENGQLKEKVNFKNGKEVSKTSFKYHENGQLRIQHEENPKEPPTEVTLQPLEVVTGPVRVSDGITYDQNTNELVTGIVEKFYENGELWFYLNFKDGKQEGLADYFDKYGNLTMTETYKNGELVQ